MSVEVIERVGSVDGRELVRVRLESGQVGIRFEDSLDGEIKKVVDRSQSPSPTKWVTPEDWVAIKIGSAIRCSISGKTGQLIGWIGALADCEHFVTWGPCLEVRA